MISRKVTSNNTASAVGGKTARACDNCIRKRARWYCAADDAFLCQACDGSVHSANTLARRHERVRLKTSSHKHLTIDIPVQKVSETSWHHGFTKKARTPRHGKGAISFRSIPLVPEVGEDNTSNEENDEQLLYRVPAYDPLVAELYTSVTSKVAAKSINVANDSEVISANRQELSELAENCGPEKDHLKGFLPSDRDLAEFAADVESLLGGGLENESFCMEGLGLIDCNERDSQECSLDSRNKVKIEEEEVVGAKGNVGSVEAEIDMSKESFELNFEYDSPASCGEEEEEKKFKVVNTEAKSVKCCKEENGAKESKNRKILLRLDYEAVIAAWASHGSPWKDGGRPNLNPDVCWPDYLGIFGTEAQNPYGDRGYGGYMGIGDAGREAKVSRYREKRRTRLFSKKIRYEVRKLNAEKRPRMKGRFVKRTSFGGPAFPLLNK